MNKAKREQKMREQQMHEQYMIDEGYGVDYYEREAAEERCWKNEIESRFGAELHRHPLPKFITEQGLELGVEYYYEKMLDVFWRSDYWHELFGLPSFLGFSPRYSVKPMQRAMNDCYGLLVDRLDAWAAENADKLAEFVERLRTSSYHEYMLKPDREKNSYEKRKCADGWILEHIMGFADGVSLDAIECAQGAWLEYVSHQDKLVDAAGKWTPVGMYFLPYMDEYYKHAERGSSAWDELVKEGFIVQ